VGDKGLQIDYIRNNAYFGTFTYQRKWRTYYLPKIEKYASKIHLCTEHDTACSYSWLCQSAEKATIEHRNGYGVSEGCGTNQPCQYSTRQR
jgi:hypothetical protein